MVIVADRYSQPNGTTGNYDGPQDNKKFHGILSGVRTQSRVTK